MSGIEQEVRTIFKLSKVTWALIATVILGWGGLKWTVTDHGDQLAAQQAQIDRKLDKEAATEQFKYIVDKIESIHQDVRELRSAKRKTEASAERCEQKGLEDAR